MLCECVCVCVSPPPPPLSLTLPPPLSLSHSPSPSLSLILPPPLPLPSPSPSPFSLPPLLSLSDALPTVTGIVRGPSSRQVWTIQLRHHPRSHTVSQPLLIYFLHSSHNIHNMCLSNYWSVCVCVCVYMYLISWYLFISVALMSKVHILSWAVVILCCLRHTGKFPIPQKISH